MNSLSKTTQLVANLFALLFTLAAGIQLLQWDKFAAQLADSPIFSSFYSLFFWLIPVMEIMIAALLFKRKTKVTGLYFASFWFVLFTYYILFVLNFSTYIPCTCGGSFLSMSWNNQLLFNTVCILISAAALSFNKPNTYALSRQTKFRTHFNN